MNKFWKKFFEILVCIAIVIGWCVMFFGGLLCVALFWGGP